ncbi:tryptophan 7-halogenase [bacterium]|nr:tryptophan 7-halogenase [bacterium]
MKSQVKKIVVLGGGASGWFTAGYLKHKNPEIDITLIESPKVGIVGVGESTIPQLGDFFREMGIEERDWMASSNSIYKLGNKFVGWNIEGKRHHVTNHWHCHQKDEQYFTFSWSLPEKHIKTSYYNQLKTDDYYFNSAGKNGVDDKWNDYWLQSLREGTSNAREMSEDLMEATFLMENKKAPFDMDDHQMIGSYNSYAWHVDAERFPEIVRDRVALPAGVKHIWGHVDDIQKDDEGYITKLVLEDGTEYEADLFCDATGFNRILTGTMDNGWHDYEHIFTRDAIVGPVKYKDVYNEMRPYTQSYAQDAGWNFIIPLYNRMGSGYIYDRNEITKEQAMEDFKKYWEGYEFIKEPRHISWESGRMETPWNKNVVGIGMAGAFVEPMEANSLYVAQASIQLVNRIINRAKEDDPVITKSQMYAFNKNMSKLEDGIADFISYHFTLSDREDTPFWRKVKQYGIDHNHKEANWEHYRRPVNFLGNGVYPDQMWAMLGVYMDKFDDNVELRAKPELMEMAKIKFDYIHKSSKAIGNYAPHAYDWHRKFLYDDKPYDTVLAEALAKASRNLY